MREVEELASSGKKWHQTATGNVVCALIGIAAAALIVFVIL